MNGSQLCSPCTQDTVIIPFRGDNGEREKPMATAKQLPSGIWRTIVYIGKDENGKKKYKSFTDSDKRRCERKASEYADENRIVRESSPFGSALNDFLTLRKAILSPSTYRGYKSADRYFQTHYRAFYDASVYDLTAERLQRLINDMVESGQSPKSVSNKIGLVSAVLRFKEVKMPTVRLPEKKKPDYHIPDVKEVENLLKAAKGKDIEVPILLAVCGGMRRSEICALTMDDIHGDTISINKAIVLDDDLKPVSKSTKTYESKRDVPLPHELIEMIKEKGCITEVTNPERISERFSHIARQAKCPKTRFHDLRHFHVSYLSAKGIPEQFIMERCGFRTDNVMKKVYRHTLHSEEQTTNKSIVSYFSDIIENGQHDRQHKP